MNEVAQLAEQAAFRCQGYWLLSRLFLEAPTPALLGDLHAALASAEGGSPAQEADLAFLRRAVTAAAADPETAAVEFTRRFVAVPKDCGEPLPFESHVLDGQLPGPATEELVRRMAAWGYRSSLVEAAPPDHIGAELRLMSLLCHEEREAWLRGEPDSARQSLARENELLSQHLLRWIPDYCSTLASRSEHAYVQAIARLTVSTLAAEAAELATQAGERPAEMTRPA